MGSNRFWMHCAIASTTYSQALAMMLRLGRLQEENRQGATVKKISSAAIGMP